MISEWLFKFESEMLRLGPKISIFKSELAKRDMPAFASVTLTSRAISASYIRSNVFVVCSLRGIINWSMGKVLIT